MLCRYGLVPTTHPRQPFPLSSSAQRNLMANTSSTLLANASLEWSRVEMSPSFCPVTKCASASRHGTQASILATVCDSYYLYVLVYNTCSRDPCDPLLWARYNRGQHTARQVSHVSAVCRVNIRQNGWKKRSCCFVIEHMIGVHHHLQEKEEQILFHKYGSSLCTTF